MVSAATPSQATPTDENEVTHDAIVALVAQGVRVVAEHMGTESDASDVPTSLPIGSFGASDAGELLLGLTHDIRSPLTSILVLVEQLRNGRSGPVTPLQERQLGLVYTAAFGLSAFAEDVLDLARDGSRLVDGHPQVLSIHGVFRRVRELLQPMAEEKGLTLRYSAPLDDRRIGHEAAIERVVLNLATNALKFTNSGVVALTATYVGDTGVLFEVSDTGTGMPIELRDRIGKTSWETGSALNSAGLGLGLCAQLVARMQGAMHFTERTPCGSIVSFSLSLPRA